MWHNTSHYQEVVYIAPANLLQGLDEPAALSDLNSCLRDPVSVAFWDLAQCSASPEHRFLEHRFLWKRKFHPKVHLSPQFSFQEFFHTQVELFFFFFLVLAKLIQYTSLQHALEFLLCKRWHFLLHSTNNYWILWKVLLWIALCIHHALFNGFLLDQFKTKVLDFIIGAVVFRKEKSEEKKKYKSMKQSFNHRITEL